LWSDSLYCKKIVEQVDIAPNPMWIHPQMTQDILPLSC
jgi:hypothetical protein